MRSSRKLCGGTFFAISAASIYGRSETPVIYDNLFFGASLRRPPRRILHVEDFD